MHGTKSLMAVVLLTATLAACQTTVPASTTKAPLGTTQASAIPIPSIPAEYDWIARNRPGWEPVQQALIIDGNRAYDLITLQKGGATDTVYFDITGFFFQT